MAASHPRRLTRGQGAADPLPLLTSIRPIARTLVFVTFFFASCSFLFFWWSTNSPALPPNVLLPGVFDEPAWSAFEGALGRDADVAVPPPSGTPSSEAGSLPSSDGDIGDSTTIPPSFCAFQDPLAHLRQRIKGNLSTPLAIQDGFVHFNGSSSSSQTLHPMLGLIEAGWRELAGKLERQSETLDEAIAEYGRRNGGRHPPPGFPEWFNFARENDVVFPDEYDRIQQVLLPWRALRPGDRRARLREAETVRIERDGTEDKERTQALVRVISDGKGRLEWEPLLPAPSRQPVRHPHAPSGGEEHSFSEKLGRNKRRTVRAETFISLLDGIRHHLPAFTIVLNTFDQPIVVLPPGKKKQLEELALRGQYVQGTTEDDDERLDWDAVCADYPQARSANETDLWTLVSNAETAGDACLHSQIRSGHGLFLQENGLSSKPHYYLPLLPIWSTCSTIQHADLLSPAIGIEGRFPRPGPEDVNWNLKKQEIFWRGSLTGVRNKHADRKGEVPLWRRSHRYRLVRFANDMSSNVVSLLAVDERGQALFFKTCRWTLARWVDVKLAASRAWLWFSFWPELGQQCEIFDGTCSALKESLAYTLKVPEGTVDRYKYALDVDGNGWSARFPRLMASKSLVIKSTVFTEWNSETFPAWSGYVPLSWSFQELHAILAFFRGPPDGPDGQVSEASKDFDEIARIMAENGRCWEQRTTRWVDMQAYMLRALIEYAALFNEVEAEDL